MLYAIINLIYILQALDTSYINESCMLLWQGYQHILTDEFARYGIGKKDKTVASLASNSVVNFAVFLLLLIFTNGILASDKPFAPTELDGAVIVSAEEVVNMILNNKQLTIIDSRKRTEYVKGHIEGAINLLNTEMKPDDLESLVPDKSNALLFYCNGIRCLRSSNAISESIKWGYTNIYWFRGGWSEWTEKKLPVIVE